ncbi:MAG: glutamate 5-kinase [Myxococcales bacterium]|nr:MAG: glutamate 5-kinase [Myxococcales bacterium]
MNQQEIARGVRRLVVKLGSSVVATPTGVDRERVSRLTAEAARLHDDGYEIILVTSGARAAGLARLGLRSMPKTIPEQQAAAAIGQIRLMSLYEECFSVFGKHVGQVLLTAADIEDRGRYLNARHTIDHLLSHGIVPVVNENDSVAVDELKFGDNDRLSALVAGLAGADLLVILTDVDGLYTGAPSAPGARLVDIVDDIDAAARAAGAAPGPLGTGGMASKVASARSAAHRGIPTVIANGRTDGTLTGILEGEGHVGTLVLASDTPISNRKHWIAYGTPVHGTLVVDAGAVRALTERGGSLLPSGIIEVRGRFQPGDCVSCSAPDGCELARGLVAYGSVDCDRIKGLISRRIQETLGYHISDEVMHRDDLVLLEDLGRRRGHES